MTNPYKLTAEADDMTTIATTVDGGTISLWRPADRELRGAVSGDLMLQDHPGYENARRVWNGNVDRRPAIITRCSGVADSSRS